MVSEISSNAMAEVLYYLKGIRQEDIDKIPKKFMEYLNKNASKEYQCNFDYNKPLNELQLLEETRGIIGMICYNYWCISEEQKNNYIKKLTDNEQKYQKELYDKYNPNDLFKNKTKVEYVETNENILPIKIKKENVFKKIVNYIKNLFIKNI